MGEVAHYRDADKLECDAVVHLRDGRYGLIEIKLGGEALVPYGTYRCRQHCIQTPIGWHLCRSDRLSETLI